MYSKNDNRYIQIGLKIAYYRKLRKYTQETLAEALDISAGYMGQVEAPGMVTPISLDLLFAIADELCIPPHRFLEFDELD